MVKPLALATWSAPARVARAIGLPALLVKTASVSASADDSPKGIRIAIAAAMQRHWRFILLLPLMRCYPILYPIRASSSPPDDRKSCRTDMPDCGFISGRLPCAPPRPRHAAPGTCVLQRFAVDEADFER